MFKLHMVIFGDLVFSVYAIHVLVTYLYTFICNKYSSKVSYRIHHMVIEKDLRIHLRNFVLTKTSKDKREYPCWGRDTELY